MKAVQGFLAFLYDFLVGDDWRIALAVAAGLALTYGLSHAGVPAWWVLPVAVVVALTVSVWRVARPLSFRARGERGAAPRS